jgi:hypothetical protein
MVPFFLKAMRSIVHMYTEGASQASQASHGDIVGREHRLELTYELDIVCVGCFIYMSGREGKGRELQAEGRRAGTGRRGG